MACMALGVIGGDQATKILRKALITELDEDVIEVIEDSL